MSHLVSLSPPIPGAHTIKKYAGFGIRGADIPTTGDNGGSPVLNDGILPGSEYYWRVETPPGSGTLTIFPDLSFELDGAADGDWTWQYRLFEDGTDEGVATVSVHVGGHDVTIASSQQVNQASPASVRQTHLISVSDSQQGNQSSAAAIQQTHKVGAADSQQSNAASAASVSQSSTTFISAANSIQINQADAAAIRQTHLLSFANSQQGNQASSIGIQQTHLLGVASSQQVNQASAAAVLQVISGYVIAADSQQINQASAAAVRQTHLIGIASSQQINQATGGSIYVSGPIGSLSDSDIQRLVVAFMAALNATTIPVSAVTGNWPTATQNADAVWSKTLP